MPSLATRRRRAGAAEGAPSDLLEGGGNRGQQTADAPRDTEEKLAKFRAQSRRAGELSQRAHLVAFPLFLFALLVIFSGPLDLSLLSCAFIPLALGLLLFLATVVMERAIGRADQAGIVQQHGQPKAQTQPQQLQPCPTPALCGMAYGLRARDGQDGRCAGTPAVVLLIILTLLGLALAQHFFRNAAQKTAQ